MGGRQEAPRSEELRLLPLTLHQMSLAKRLVEFRREVYRYDFRLGVTLSQAGALAWLHASPMFEEIVGADLHLTMRPGIVAAEVFARVGGMISASVRQLSEVLAEKPDGEPLAARGRALADDLDAEVQHLSVEIAAGHR